MEVNSETFAPLVVPPPLDEPPSPTPNDAVDPSPDTSEDEFKKLSKDNTELRAQVSEMSERLRRSSSLYESNAELEGSISSLVQVKNALGEDLAECRREVEGERVERMKLEREVEGEKEDECRRLEVIVVGTESATPQKQAPGSAGGTIISSTPTGEPSTPQNSMGQQGSSSELRPPGSTSSMASEKSTEEESQEVLIGLLKTENNDLRVKIAKLESDGVGGGGAFEKLSAKCSSLELGSSNLSLVNESLKSELSSVHSQLDRLTAQQDSSTATNDLRITRIMEETAAATKRAEEKVQEKEGEVERLRETVENVKGQMSRAEEFKGRLDASEVDLRMARRDLEGSEVAMGNMHVAMQNLQGERESEIKMMEQQAEEEMAGEREAFEGRLEALAEVHESNVAEVRAQHKKEMRIEKDKLETINFKLEGNMTENVGLRRSLDEAIKRLQASQEDIIDRVLMKNILLDWHGKSGDERRDVMAVMASLLHFTDEEKASAELYFERKEDKGMVGRVVGGIVAPLPPPVLDVEQLEGENVRDKFVSYLLAESGGD
ncbi:hypothetical protein TrRE_jg6780 [Triparma retinervis]|uniref:GRIP domain-containing protein n=1 Tax=Triparma retinervis TaxID=2557542 RepID=A0A9W7L7Z7_9STRA|nr:hypothetical protein TrRE_jg6780 [Triparma retinervis]